MATFTDVHDATDHTGLPGVSGSVATDAIWDAAGDLAVGSGANTAAKLTAGSEDDVLTIVSGVPAWAAPSGGAGISSGTSFPGSPSDNDLFYRTDRDKLYFYDGTRWLTVQEFSVEWGWRASQGASGLSSTTTMAQATVPADDIYLTDLLTTCFVASASSGTQFWTLDIEKRDAANSPTSIGSVSTVSNTTANWVQEVASLNHLVDGATYPVILLTATKVSTVGTLLFGVDLRYRLVG